MIQRLTRSRGILHNRRPASLGRRVRAGDIIGARVADREEPTLQPVEMELSVLYEDGELLVVDKPPVILVHPTSPRHERTLAHGIAHYFHKSRVDTKVRPVHRLDRDTTGALIIAKSRFAHQHLDRQIRTGEVEREYLAVVEGEVGSDGVVDAPIGRVPGKPHLRRVAAGGQPARTDFWVEERLNGFTVVRARLETGRTHQLRVHFSHLGHPLLGDRQYGASVTGFRRYALHSWRAAFEQPRTGARVKVTAPIPDDIQALVESLGGKAER